MASLEWDGKAYCTDTTTNAGCVVVVNFTPEGVPRLLSKFFFGVVASTCGAGNFTLCKILFSFGTSTGQIFSKKPRSSSGSATDGVAIDHPHRLGLRAGREEDHIDNREPMTDTPLPSSTRPIKLQVSFTILTSHHKHRPTPQLSFSLGTLSLCDSSSLFRV